MYEPRKIYAKRSCYVRLFTRSISIYASEYYRQIIQYPFMILETDTNSRTLAEIVVETHLCRHNIFEPHNSMPKYIVQKRYTQLPIMYHSSPEDALHLSTPLLYAERIDMPSRLGPTAVKLLAIDSRIVEKRQHTTEDGKWSSRRVPLAQTQDKLVR